MIFFLLAVIACLVSFLACCQAASLYSCHLVIPMFNFRRSSSCGDSIGKSLPSVNE